MHWKVKIITAALTLLGAAVLNAQPGKKKPAPVAKPVPVGHNITLNIAPFKNQWLYLAYHYGNVKGLADSAFADASGKAVFKGSTPLQNGIYIVASPTKTILFEMLMGTDQVFSVVGDTLDLNTSIKFVGSDENMRFLGYTSFVNRVASKGEAARQQLSKTEDALEKARLEKVISASGTSIDSFRTAYCKQYPADMLTVLFKGMSETKLPAALQNPKTNADSLAQYRFAKSHFWDGIDFMDGRLVRTPILEAKLKTYLNSWVIPEADSLIYEFNWMIALGRNDPEMFRFLIGYFVDNYMYPKLMGQDKVFLHVFERYIGGDKPKADWLNERQLKIIRERAYMVMANQLGSAAWDMDLVDTAGKPQNLYGVKAKYTVVAFWDVHCGKCREELPKMDTLYRESWQRNGVKIYAVMVNEENVKDWPAFINEHAKGWSHVHQTAAMRKAEEKTQKPNFRQLYDMRSTPTLFLLDADKKIIAKSIGLTDLDKVLQQKFAQGQ
ncbi:MAG: DUF5106 domain-containing protein [Bacteroidetes bacterium]|nr:MAG: DUF5106 domain-containing protein [Bacteroidota bacterium]